MTNPLTPERLIAIGKRRASLMNNPYPMRFDPLLTKDLPDLIAEIKKLQKALEKIAEEAGKVDISNWPAQQQICQSIANKSLGRDINGKEPTND